MICKNCKESGLKSHVYPAHGTSTCMYFAPFYDKDGKYHDHDANTFTANYACSNGHTWTESRTGSCWCGWPNKKETE